MNGISNEHSLLHKEECLSNKDESSPPESKRICLDKDSNKNRNTIVNWSENNTRWSYSEDINFVKSEMEDMGVSILNDVTLNSKNIKSQSEECTTSPIHSDSNKKLLTNIPSDIECHEEIHKSSSLDTVNVERIEHDLSNLIELTAFNGTENTSNYISKMEESLSITVDKTILDHFYLYRRKRKPSVMGENKFNKLSDEIILMIFKWLPKKYLVRCMLVCKRWHQITRDEVLWTRLDLGNKVLSEGTLGHILPRGVQILRLSQAEIADSVFYENSEVLSEFYISKLQYLDLSMAVISSNGLAALLSKCKYLKKLSLEKCIINKACCTAISQNMELEILNVTMCEDMDIGCIMKLMRLKRLTTLNMAWCNLDGESLSLLCKTLPSTITRLNIAGYRKITTDRSVKDLSIRCPDIIELDLSDSALLTINAINSLLNFSKLEHLSLNRCYGIPQSAYTRLAQLPSLLYINIYGLMSELVLKSFRETWHISNMRLRQYEPEINKFPYSSIARPTVGIRRTSIWGLRVRD